MNTALGSLSGQIKKIFEILMAMSSDPKKAQDAMFSKKPFLGASCASCEKNIKNLSRCPPEFQTWSKFPLRDSSKRELFDISEAKEQPTRRDIEKSMKAITIKYRGEGKRVPKTQRPSTAIHV